MRILTLGSPPKPNEIAQRIEDFPEPLAPMIKLSFGPGLKQNKRYKFMVQ